MTAHRTPLRETIDADGTLGSRPNPDPTIRTEQQLTQRMQAQAELFDVRVSTLEEKVDEFHARIGGQLRLDIEAAIAVIEARLAGNDKAVTRLQENFDKTRSVDVVYQELLSLAKVTAEKFATIQIQFTDRDLALIAALAAAEKAVGVQNNNNLLANTKQEAAISKQIDGISNLLTAMTKGFDDKIDGLKERLNAIERNAQGTVSEGKGIDKTWAVVAVALTLIIAGTSLFIASERSATIPMQPQVIYAQPPAPPTVIK